MRTKKTLIMIMVLIGSVLVPLKTLAGRPDIATIKVIKAVAKKHGIDVNDLLKIAYTESRFNSNAVRTNKNGTIDIGMFQINSVHWDTTCAGIEVLKLAGNAECAARIIKKIKIRHGLTDANWLGRYHSKTPSKKLLYMTLLASAENNLK